MEQKRYTRAAVLWNTASGMINAGQSAVILIFISQFLSQRDAGIFVIGYALGNLFSTMGKYGVRNYQVTDIAETYSFAQYRRARYLTGAGALVLTALFLAFQYVRGSYEPDKLAVIFLICLWKMIDTVEDVYYGMYQQRGRLDIGARCYTVRLTLSTAAFCVLILAGCSLLAAAALVTALSAALAALLVRTSVKNFDTETAAGEPDGVKKILLVCFPLFVGTSLSIYVGNAPKYLIDWFLDEGTQAVFGYIMMPAFVIQVLNQFIYQPMIRGLGELWQNGDRNRFVSRVLRQYVIVFALTAVVIAGGLLVGIPLLSLLYNVDLAPYRVEFAVILLGGGIYALVSFLMVPITAMRFQKCVTWGFLIAAVGSILIGRHLIPAKGVMGAAVLYLILNAALAVYFTLCFLYKGKIANEAE